MTLTTNRVLVIGAGVAGCSFAIRLLQLGFQVEVAEKAPFPRNKVCGCCLGGTGLSLLNLLGLGPWMDEYAVALRQWQGAIGGRSLRIGLKAGAAVSRQSLDTKLVERVVELGGVVHQPCSARIEAQCEHHVDVTLTMDGHPCSRDYGLVVVAAGLNAHCFKPDEPTVDLDWIDQPHGPFGVATHVDGLEHVEPGVIYMVCDDNGYVGLVRLEDGRVDVAAALQRHSSSEKRTPQQRLSQMLENSPLRLGEFDIHAKLMTTPPLRRRRRAGKGRVLAIGDAAGYIEPFTGEGMTWGMQAGFDAADFIVRRGSLADGIGDQWQQVYAKTQRWHRLQCRVMTSALTSPWLRRSLGTLLHFAPSVAIPVTNSLARPTHSKPIPAIRAES